MNTYIHTYIHTSIDTYELLHLSINVHRKYSTMTEDVSSREILLLGEVIKLVVSVCFVMNGPINTSMNTYTYTYTYTYIQAYHDHCQRNPFCRRFPYFRSRSRLREINLVVAKQLQDACARRHLRSYEYSELRRLHRYSCLYANPNDCSKQLHNECLYVYM